MRVKYQLASNLVLFCAILYLVLDKPLLNKLVDLGHYGTTSFGVSIGFFILLYCAFLAILEYRIFNTSDETRRKKLFTIQKRGLMFTFLFLVIFGLGYGSLAAGFGDSSLYLLGVVGIVASITSFISVKLIAKFPSLGVTVLFTLIFGFFVYYTYFSFASCNERYGYNAECNSKFFYEDSSLCEKYGSLCFIETAMIYNDEMYCDNLKKENFPAGHQVKNTIDVENQRNRCKQWVRYYDGKFSFDIPRGGLIDWYERYPPQ